MLHKRQKVLSGTNFLDLPENIIPAINSNISILVTGSGLIKGTSGLRWWDSNLLTDNGIVAGIQDVPIVLPFTNAYLYPGLVDLIAEVTIGTETFFYAASNSPDNAVTTAAASNAIVYYLDLFCCELYNNVQSPATNSRNHYMQGGIAAQAEFSFFAQIRLSEPAPTSGSFTVVVQYFAYNGSAPAILPFVKTVSYTAGATSINAISGVELVTYYYTVGGYVTWQHAGYYKISVTNTDPNYRSLLNYYHWGMSS